MLTTLKQIVQEVSRTPGLDAALNRLVTLVKAAMEVDSCSIYLANYEKQHLVLTATNGLDPNAVGKVCIGFSEGLIGLVGQREEPLNIENAHEHPRFKHYPEVKEEEYNAFLGTPIIYQRKVLGVMTMQQKDMRRFSPDEEAFLVTLATQIALEIANADMLGEFREVLLCTEAHDMRQARPGVLELGQVGLREELGAWKLGIELLALSDGPASAFVGILSPCALVEPFRVPIPVLSPRQNLARQLFRPDVEGVVGEEVCRVHLVLTIGVFRDARNNEFGLFSRNDSQLHLDMNLFQLLGKRLSRRVE